MEWTFMNGGTTLPVVIGISAGIAMIVIFALLINHDLKLRRPALVVIFYFHTMLIKIRDIDM